MTPDYARRLLQLLLNLCVNAKTMMDSLDHLAQMTLNHLIGFLIDLL